jgi:biopolymer transport protein ExbD
MAMNSLSDDDDQGLMNEINMTPLVDVMLVLLIIFLVTIPALQHAVRIDLPHASSQPVAVKPAHVDVAVQADGSLMSDGQPVSDQDLRARIAQAALATPQPELHLRADRKVAYERVAAVMSAAQSGGITKIGFITDPQPQK